MQQKNYRSILLTAALLSAVVGLLVITGWIFDIAVLKSVYPGYVSMRFNTAICFIFTGIALYFFVDTKFKFSGLLSILFTSLVLIIGLISFTEDIWNYNAGIDELFFKVNESSGPVSTIPGRMATATSFCFILIGLSFLTIKAKSFYLKTFSQFALHSVSLVAFIAAIGYLYKVPTLYKLSFITSMALHTSVLFLIVSVCASFYNPHAGVTGIFVGNRLGSRMAQRLFPLTCLMLLFLGFLRLQAHRFSLLSVEFGIALFALSFLILSILIIAVSARYLNKIDLKREDAEKELSSMNKKLEQLVKKRTEDLQIITERLSLATEGSKIGIWDWDIINDKLSWDEKMYELYGITSSTFSGAYQAWVNGLHPDDKEKGNVAIQNAMAGIRDFDTDFRVIWPDKSIHYIKAFSIVQRDKQGNAIRMVGTNWDITDQKKQLELLQRSEEKFRSLLEAAPDAMVIVNKEGEMVLINHQAEILFGYTQEEMIGKKVEMLLPSDIQHKHLDHRQSFFKIPKTRSMGSGLELYAERKNGIKFPVEISLSPLETPSGLLVSAAIRDITTSKDATEALRKSEEQLKTIFSGAPDAVILIDENGVVDEWNPQATHLFGWTKEEIIGKSLSDTIVPHQYRQAHTEGMKRYLNSGKSNILGKNIEIKALKKDATEFDIALSISPIQLKNRHMFIGFIRDITEQKKKDEIILNNERKFRQALTIMGDNVWEHDFKGGKTIFAETIHDFTGYTNEEISNEETLWWSLVHPDDRWMIEESDKKYKTGAGNSHHLEYRMIDKSGTVKWVLDRGVIIEKDQHQKPLKIVGTHTDITVRKSLEETVVESEKRFRDLTQNVPGVIYQWQEYHDGSFGFTYISPKIKDYFGLEPDEMSKFVDLIHPDDKEKWRTSVEEASKTGSPWFFEGRLLYPDGSIKWWQGSSIMSHITTQGKIFNGFILDLTKEKEIEEKFKLQQKRFEGIFNSAYQFIGLMSPDGILLEANETALQFANIKREDVAGKPIWELPWCANDPEFFKEVSQRAGKGEFVRENIQITGMGGMKIWVDFSLKPIFNEENELTFIIPEARDITEQLMLQNITKEQEEKIRLFVKHTPAAVAMLDQDFTYIVASDRWYTDYGIKDNDIIGKNHLDIFPDVKNNKEWFEVIQRSLKGSIEIKEEEKFQLSNGVQGWLHWEVHPWKKHDGSIGGIIIFSEIITEQVLARENLKKLNEQLTISNNDLEQFAYIASHDLQEPLRMVSSFLQLLEKKYKPALDETAGQYIHFAVDGAERMKVLIKDLLAFSRIGTAKEELTTIDLTKTLEEIKLNLSASIEESNAAITISKMPVIVANKTQVTQLFQNLIGNAIKYRGADQTKIEIEFSDTASHWQFCVKDNGIGIDPKYFEKIFIVFQRLHTKSVYSGTGIGLSICKKIVEKHNGTIWVESAEGKGSSFHFTLSKNL